MHFAGTAIIIWRRSQLSISHVREANDQRTSLSEKFFLLVLAFDDEKETFMRTNCIIVIQISQALVCQVSDVKKKVLQNQTGFSVRKRHSV